MNFLAILEQVRLVKNEIVAGNFAEAWRLTLPLQEMFLDLINNLGFRASPEDEENGKLIVKELEECKKACDVPAPKGNENQPVGKLGDGKILKFLIEAFLKFAPLFFKADPNAPVNEESATDSGTGESDATQPRPGSRAAKAQQRAQAQKPSEESDK